MSRTGSRSPRELRDLVRARDGDDCSICGQPVDFTIPAGEWMGPSLEHVVPLAAGGTNDPANLRLAHAFPCNAAKAAAHAGHDYAAAADPAQGPRQVTPRHERQVAAALAKARAAARKGG